MGKRVTVTFSDAAAKLVTEYAESRRITRSRAVSDLIEKSFERKLQVTAVDGLALFDFPVIGGSITTEDVRSLEGESW